jgi:hypothetical protein
MKLGKIDNTSLAGKKSGLFKSCARGSGGFILMLSGLFKSKLNDSLSWFL